MGSIDVALNLKHFRYTRQALGRCIENGTFLDTRRGKMMVESTFRGAVRPKRIPERRVLTSSEIYPPQ